MTRERIPVWEQERAIATWLWERGPMSARYPGQMFDQMREVYRKTLDYTTVPGRNQVGRVVVGLIVRGLIDREGTEQKPTKLTYVGPDPALIDWRPDDYRAASTVSDPGVAARIAALEATVADQAVMIEALDAQLAALARDVAGWRTTVGVTVSQAVEEVVRRSGGIPRMRRPDSLDPASDVRRP